MGPGHDRADLMREVTDLAALHNMAAARVPTTRRKVQKTWRASGSLDCALTIPHHQEEEEDVEEDEAVSWRKRSVFEGTRTELLGEERNGRHRRCHPDSKSGAT